MAKYLDFERNHANFFNELGELAHYIKQALQDIQKNIGFDKATGTYGVDKLNRTNFKELSRLYASQQAIDDKIKEIEDIGLTPVIPNGNSAGFMMNDGQLNTTATLGFVNEQMIYWQNESTFRELLLVGSSYRVLYVIDAVTGQHVTDSRLAFDLLVLASSAFGVSSFATRFGAVKTAAFDKNVVLKNIEASKVARASSNFNVYASKEKAVLRDVEGRIYGTEKASESKSIITSEMEEKILWGQRKNPNKNEIIGGHSSTINNSNPNYATETIKINSERTRDIKFTTQFPDGNLAKIKNSTVFPDGWSDTKILDSIKDIGNSSPISVRGRDGATFHRAIVDGVEIDVIKLGDNIISGYPTGKVNAPFPGGFTR